MEFGEASDHHRADAVVDQEIGGEAEVHRHALRGLDRPRLVEDEVAGGVGDKGVTGVSRALTGWEVLDGLHPVRVIAEDDGRAGVDGSPSVVRLEPDRVRGVLDAPPGAHDHVVGDRQRCGNVLADERRFEGRRTGPVRTGSIERGRDRVVSDEREADGAVQRLDGERVRLACFREVRAGAGGNEADALEVGDGVEQRRRRGAGRQQSIA